MNPGRKAWLPRQVFLKQFEANSLSNPFSHVGRLAAEYRWNQDGMTGWSIGTWMQMAGKTVKVVELLFLKGGRFSMYRYKRASTKTRMWSHPKNRSFQEFASRETDWWRVLWQGAGVFGEGPYSFRFVKSHLSSAKVKPIWSFAGLSGPAALYTGRWQKSLGERNGSNLEVTTITAMHFS